MNARRIEITLSQERWDALEAARGHEPRASFIKRALDTALTPVPSGGATMQSQEPFEGKRPMQLPKRPPVAPGVKTAREHMLERQRRLNEGKP